MSGWREQKREARRVVHETMAIDALFYRVAGASESQPIRPRLHSKFNLIGDDRSMGWAEREAVKPRLIFMLSELAVAEISLARGNIIFFAPGEAYVVEALTPPDDITVTAEVTRMSAKQLQNAGLPLAAGSAP